MTRTKLAVLLLISGLPGASVRAQVPQPALRIPATLETSSSELGLGVPLALLGAGVAGSLLDGHLAHEAQKLRLHSPSSLRQLSQTASSVGGIAPLAAAFGLSALGEVRHDAGMTHLGLETTRAVLESSVLTLMVKGMVGRARPSSTLDDPDQYYPGRGFAHNAMASFPSGHTTAAFAAATVLATELGRAHPSRRPLLEAAFYGAATLVGLSRVYQNAHWSSDVAAGAALGIAGGLRAVKLASAGGHP